MDGGTLEYSGGSGRHAIRPAIWPPRGHGFGARALLGPLATQWLRAAAFDSPAGCDGLCLAHSVWQAWTDRQFSGGALRYCLFIPLDGGSAGLWRHGVSADGPGAAIVD